MIVNKNILRQHTNDEVLITRIMMKARNIGVKIFERMGTSKNGAICPATHFNLNEMIEAMQEHVKVVRSCYRKHNEVLLEDLKMICERIGNEKRNNNCIV